MHDSGIGLVLGGIVTYNPDIKRLKENLSTLINQVDKLYIFDNGSNNLKNIELLLESFTPQITLYKANKNLGIAYALKEIMNYARIHNFDWVLSVDQDSVLDKYLVRKYKTTIENCKYNDIGILTCLIKDRNFKDSSVEKQKRELMEVPICITSAAFTNVKNYFQTHGYDTNLFIDMVDTDICLSLREKGFKIFRINYVGVTHEIGHGENKRILNKDIIVHHSAIFREYYMSRNTILLRKKHPSTYSKKTMLKGLILNFLIILFFERNKNKRFNNYFKGIIDGIRK